MIESQMMQMQMMQPQISAPGSYMPTLAHAAGIGGAMPKVGGGGLPLHGFVGAAPGGAPAYPPSFSPTSPGSNPYVQQQHVHLPDTPGPLGGFYQPYPRQIVQLVQPVQLVPRQSQQVQQQQSDGRLFPTNDELIEGYRTEQTEHPGHQDEYQDPHLHQQPSLSLQFQ